MANYKELFDIHVKYIDFLLQKTHFLHQSLNDIKDSGDNIEIEIRNLFSKLLPKRLKVTHGYIAKAENSKDEPVVSPQVDMIIVDTLVPHSLFAIDNDNGMEVVPVESVVGIFEIKRTLNNNSLFSKTGALQHLYDICNSVCITKYNYKRYFTGGLGIDNQKGIIVEGGYNSNPIIGIIGLEHDKSFQHKYEKKTLTKYIRNDKAGNPRPNLPEYDFIVSLSGWSHYLISKDSQNLLVETARANNEVYYYGENYYIDGKNYSKSAFIARIFGYMLTYLQLTSGRIGNISNYFINESIC